MTTQKIKEKIAHYEKMLAAKEKLSTQKFLRTIDGKLTEFTLTQEMVDAIPLEYLQGDYTFEVTFTEEQDNEGVPFDFDLEKQLKETSKIYLENFAEQLLKEQLLKDKQEKMTAKEFMLKYPGLTENWENDDLAEKINEGI